MNLMRAARYLGVAPWDLADQHPMWIHRAVTLSHADAMTRDVQNKKS